MVFIGAGLPSETGRQYTYVTRTHLEMFHVIYLHSIKTLFILSYDSNYYFEKPPQ